MHLMHHSSGFVTEVLNVGIPGAAVRAKHHSSEVLVLLHYWQRLRAPQQGSLWEGWSMLWCKYHDSCFGRADVGLHAPFVAPGACDCDAMLQ
jgi:hypothetical protein